MYLRVTGLAKAHEVVLVMRAAFTDGKDVVDFLNGRIASLFKTAFAQRVLADVAVADPFPRTSVFLIAVCAARVPVVLLL